jgi:hypothetical protein
VTKLPLTTQTPDNQADTPASAGNTALPETVDNGADNQADTPACADNTALPETTAKVAAEPPFAIARLFAKPPALRYEDEDAYQAWQEAAQAAFRPRDLFEYIWAQDFTQLTWEIERGRRMRKALLDGARPEAMRQMIRVRIDEGQIDKFALESKAAELAHLAWKNSSSLDTFYVSDDEITAQAYRQLYKEIDLLERQIASWERRRAKLQRDFEARREKQETRAQVLEVVQLARDIIAVHWAQMGERESVATALVAPTQTSAEGDGESRAGAQGRAHDGTRRRRKGTGLRSGTLGRLGRSKQRHPSDGEAA